MINKSTIILCCFVLPGILSCSEGPGDKASGLKHEFSNIARSDEVLPDIFTRSKCEQKDYELLEGDIAVRKMQGQAVSYLEDLSAGIMSRVNASLKAEGKKEVFVGALAPDNFCYNISDSLDPYMNASMLPQTLELTVTPSVFARLSSESAIASVVCHELAHASMRHADQSIAPELKKVLLSSLEHEKRFEMAVDAALGVELIILDEAIVAKMFGDYSDTATQMFLIKYEIQDFIRSRINGILYGLATPGQMETQALYVSYRYKQYLDLFETINAGAGVSDYEQYLSPDERTSLADFTSNLKTLKKDIIGKDPTNGNDLSVYDAMQILQSLATAIDRSYGNVELSFVNWMESEADQVGLEFCARAGLNIDEFDEFHKLSSNFTSSLLLSQQDTIESCSALIERGDIPLRASDTHPTPCWRLFDVRYNEPKIHKEAFEELRLDNVFETEILGPKRLDQLKSLFE